MTDSEHRREADSEAFKYQIVAQQAEIKTKVELLHDMVTLQLADHKHRIQTLEEAVIGTARQPGLAEQNRNLVKDMAKIFAAVTIAGGIIWKILSPIYDAWANRWIPQKIESAVESKPSPRSSKIVRKK